MCRLISSILALGILTSQAMPDDRKEEKLKDQPSTKVGHGKFTIGKDTTFVTKPLDKDGYPDYAAALNERLSVGVTPENNANLLIWKALGPFSNTPMPEEYFKLLGSPRPSENGLYFELV